MTSSRRTSTPASTPASRISGINAEVMPGQWEFQVGPLARSTSSDQLWVARWLLYRIAEDFGVVGHARPEAGEGRLERRRRAHQLLDQGDARVLRRRSSPRARRSARRPPEHVEDYGAGIEDRLTGLHETAPWNEFSYGVSDRGASVRIPWQVEVDKKGYIEDRRPNANMDPYVVTRLITDTVLQRASYERPAQASTRATRPGRRQDCAASLAPRPSIARAPEGGAPWKNALPATS